MAEPTNHNKKGIANHTCYPFVIFAMCVSAIIYYLLKISEKVLRQTNC